MRFLIILLVFFSSSLFAQNWLSVKAASGDNRILLLKKYAITDQCSKDKFLALNSMKSEDFLIEGKVYKLPIKVYTYNGKSIRTTIGITDYDQAKSIQKWNEEIVTTNVKSKEYTSGGKLWVPQYLIDCYAKAKATESKGEGPEVISGKTVEHEIFGEQYKKVTVKSNKLKDPEVFEKWKEYASMRMA